MSPKSVFACVLVVSLLVGCSNAPLKVDASGVKELMAKLTPLLLFKRFSPSISSHLNHLEPPTLNGNRDVCGAKMRLTPRITTLNREAAVANTVHQIL